jgi:hypothetical protein
MKKTMFFLMLWLISLASACHKDEVDPNKIPIDFEFRLLDSNKRVASSFKTGENFWLSFLMINRSSEEWSFSENSIDKIKGFFHLYTKDSLDLGKPYGTVFCLAPGGIPIPSNDTLKIEIQWRPIQGVKYYGNFCDIKEDNPLPSLGQYKSGFSGVLKFKFKDSTYTTSALTFIKDIEIK